MFVFTAPVPSAPAHAQHQQTHSFEPRWGVGLALQEWCVGSGTGTKYIPSGTPWENPFVESFNSRIRD